MPKTIEKHIIKITVSVVASILLFAIITTWQFAITYANLEKRILIGELEDKRLNTTIEDCINRLNNKIDRIETKQDKIIDYINKL